MRSCSNADRRDFRAPRAAAPAVSEQRSADGSADRAAAGADDPQESADPNLRDDERQSAAAANSAGTGGDAAGSHPYQLQRADATGVPSDHGPRCLADSAQRERAVGRDSAARFSTRLVVTAILMKDNQREVERMRDYWRARGVWVLSEPVQRPRGQRSDDEKFDHLLPFGEAANRSSCCPLICRLLVNFRVPGDPVERGRDHAAAWTGLGPGSSATPARRP